MAILVDIHSQDWMSEEDFKKEIAGLVNEDVRFYPHIGDSGDIKMLATDYLRPGLVARLPGLELIQKLGAGVDTMVSDPELPFHVRITRIKHTTTAMEMARFCLAYVLQDVQNMIFHREKQNQASWQPVAPKRVADLTVGVLGLGHIGGTAARLFHCAGFNVVGWSRSQKSIDGIRCVSGDEGLQDLLFSSDYVASILPSTPQTENLFNLEKFKLMKPGCMLINVGRGSLIVEEDLVTALDQGCLAHAVLDVCQKEPLPEENPMWLHPGITITPHISGWDLDDGLSVVTDNYFRLIEGRELLHEIDRNSGY